MSERFTSDAKAHIEQRNGCEIVCLRNGQIILEAVPSLGGRIISIRRVDSRREWLWKHPVHSHWGRNQVGDAFEDSPLMGIDECLPTVNACSWNGLELPDHGEVWSQPWELDPALLQMGCYQAALRLPITPFTFKRSVRLCGDRIYFDYALENLSDRRQPFIWCFHPTFSIEPGDRIELPDTVKQVDVSHQHNLPEAWMPLEQWNWPKPDPGGPSLAELDLGPSENSYAKVFAAGAGSPEGEITLHNPIAGERLKLRYDSLSMPALGVWICRGGWNNAHQIAFEPCNVSANGLDELEDPMADISSITPYGTRQWSLSIALEKT